MKKKFFLIGALVAVSLSVMFVACNNNTPQNGCICTATSKEDGEKETWKYTLDEMIDVENVSTCGELTRAVREGIDSGWSVSCKGY